MQNYPACIEVISLENWLQTFLKTEKNSSEIVSTKSPCSLRPVPMQDPNCLQRLSVDNTSRQTVKVGVSRDMRFPTMWYVRPAKAQSDQNLC